MALLRRAGRAVREAESMELAQQLQQLLISCCQVLWLKNGVLLCRFQMGHVVAWMDPTLETGGAISCSCGHGTNGGPPATGPKLRAATFRSLFQWFRHGEIYPTANSQPNHWSCHFQKLSSDDAIKKTSHWLNLTKLSYLESDSVTRSTWTTKLTLFPESSRLRTWSATYLCCWAITL